jgi:hypothetical protein
LIRVIEILTLAFEGNGMNFRECVYAHLSQYRENVLRLPKGTFLYHGEKKPKGHILPGGEYYRYNILEQYRNKFFTSEHGGIKRHRYFHHLNSSQALCINLLFPLIAEKREDLLLKCLDLRLNPPVYKGFESESRVEVTERRHTSFDFHLSADGQDVYVEVKYTEGGFGAAKDDKEHHDKFEKTYIPLLSKSPFLMPLCHDRTFFLQNYQILRNLVHITERSEVLFLFPKANTIVARKADKAQRTFLTDAGRERFHILFLEDVVSKLIDGCNGGTLEAYYQRFREKYLNYCN